MTYQLFHNRALEADFNMLNQARRGSAVLKLQYGNNPGTWTTVTIPEESGTQEGVDFVITPDGDDNKVKATSPARAPGISGRIFMRSSGVLRRHE